MKQKVLSPTSIGSTTRRALARLLQNAVDLLRSLAGHATRLRARVVNAPDYISLRERISELLKELQSARRSLARRALVVATSFRIRKPAPVRSTPSRISTAILAPADLVSLLAEECRDCGIRLCALMQAAHAAFDETSERIAYSLIRVLEKQLWLLSPHTEGSTHPFLITVRA